MYRALQRMAPDIDIIHAHENWRMPILYSYWVSRQCKTKLVLSPHGTFAPWALGQRRGIKKLALASLFYRVWQHADMLHAASESEYEGLRTIGFKNPIAVIPLGVDLPQYTPDLGALGLGKERILLFLGRIHQVKRVHQLLEAWEELQSRYPDWQLVIAGPRDTSYARDMQERAKQLNLQRVHFPGYVHTQAKFTCFDAASLFVLPTESENFAIAVGEALGYGCPVVVTNTAPWPKIVDHDCGWFVDNNSAALLAALNQALSCSPEHLKKMGQNGSSWIKSEFTWDHTAETMLGAYRWVLGAADKPDCVRLD